MSTATKFSKAFNLSVRSMVPGQKVQSVHEFQADILVASQARFRRHAEVVGGDQL